MIGGGLSLFGFDLFGIGHRPPRKVDENQKRQAPSAPRNDREADRDCDRELSESFFWGMYPVY